MSKIIDNEGYTGVFGLGETVGEKAYDLGAKVELLRAYRDAYDYALAGKKIPKGYTQGKYLAELRDDIDNLKYDVDVLCNKLKNIGMNDKFIKFYRDLIEEPEEDKKAYRALDTNAKWAANIDKDIETIDLSIEIKEAQIENVDARIGGYAQLSSERCEKIKANIKTSIEKDLKWIEKLEEKKRKGPPPKKVFPTKKKGESNEPSADKNAAATEES